MKESKRVLETVSFKNSVTDRMFDIENDTSLNRQEKRVKMCEAFLELIKDKKGKDLEPHLSEVSIDTNDGSLIISVKFLPD